MKKIIVIFMALFLLTACSTKEAKFSSLEDYFKKIADDLYEKEKANIGYDYFSVTLDELEDSGYDISKIKDPSTKTKCNKLSSVTIFINDNKKEYTVNLMCNTFKSKKKEN